MKIEFLNDALTEARVTKGFWKWKRAAVVAHEDKNGSAHWFYAVNGELVEGSYDGGGHLHAGLARKLQHARQAELDRRQHAVNCAARLEKIARLAANSPWQPVAALPTAKLIAPK